MINVLQKFQSDCLLLAPELLLLIGVVIAFSGICIWLGGLRFNWFAGMFMGAGIAATACAALPLTAQAIAFTVVIAASVTLILNRPAMIFTCGILIAIASMWIFAWAGGSAVQGDYYDQLSAGYDIPINMQQSGIILGSWLKTFIENALQVASEISLILKIVAAALCIVTIFVGIVFQRVVAAVGCAMYGVAMIFAGMTTLLLYKGSQPLVVIADRPTLYVAIAVCMIVFGTVAQLVLCPFETAKKREKQKSDDKKSADSKQ